jgi:hypothetical protein
LAELIQLSSHVYERQLAVLDAIDTLDDGGLDGAGVARSKGHTSGRSAKKASATAKKLTAMPKTRKKLAAGAITPEHADAAEQTGDPEAADEELADTAAAVPADLFTKRSREWADRNTPDDEHETRHQKQRRHRRAWCATDKTTGMFGFGGDADPIVGAKLKAAWDQEYDRLWRLDGGRDGTPDDVRSPDQRRLDALANLMCGHTGTDTDTPPTPAKTTKVVMAGRPPWER